jgi:hypothetical protein
MIRDDHHYDHDDDDDYDVAHDNDDDDDDDDGQGTSAMIRRSHEKPYWGLTSASAGQPVVIV